MNTALTPEERDARLMNGLAAATFTVALSTLITETVKNITEIILNVKEMIIVRNDRMENTEQTR